MLKVQARQSWQLCMSRQSTKHAIISVQYVRQFYTFLTSNGQEYTASIGILAKILPCSEESSDTIEDIFLNILSLKVKATVKDTEILNLTTGIGYRIGPSFSKGYLVDQE